MAKKPNNDLPLWTPMEERHGDYRTRQVVELSVAKLKKILEYVEEAQEDDDRNLGSHPSVNVVGHPKPSMDKWGGSVEIKEEYFPLEESDIHFLDHVVSQFEDVQPGDQITLSEFDAFPRHRSDLDTAIVSPTSPNGHAGSKLLDKQRENREE